MKHRINLYQSQFRPKLELITLHSVVGMCATLFITLLLIGGGIRWSVAENTDRLQALEAANRQLDEDVQTLQSQLATRQPAPALKARVTLLRNTLAKQDVLLAELASREVIKSQGFAQLLSDLAAQASADLWLESIAVSESTLYLEGQVSSPRALPQWLNRLAHTPTFSGRTFDSASVTREDEALNFALQTDRQTEASEIQQGGTP